MGVSLGRSILQNKLLSFYDINQKKKQPSATSKNSVRTFQK